MSHTALEWEKNRQARMIAAGYVDDDDAASVNTQAQEAFEDEIPESAAAAYPMDAAQLAAAEFDGWTEAEDQATIDEVVANSFVEDAAQQE
jgi:hypothetical protein